MKPAQRYCGATGGFTLVELLVTLAIIAILAGLLMPSLGKAKEKGQGVVCANNGRQIALAFQSYALDNHDLLMFQPWAGGPYRNARGFRCGGEWAHTPARQLNENLGDPRVFVCPKKRRGLSYRSEAGDFDPSVTGFISYGFNYVGVFGGAANLSRAKRMSDLPAPAQVVALAEVFGSDDPARTGGNLAGDAAWLNSYWALSSFPGSVISVSDQNFKFQAQMKKHNRRATIIGLDGHVEQVRPSRMRWGQFYGRFGPGIAWLYPRWDSAVSDARLDNLETRP